MLLFSLLFLLGDVYAQTFASLPSRVSLIAIAVGTTFFSLIIRKYLRLYYLFIAFGFGFVWTAWFASNILSWKLPHCVEGKSIVIKGYIASLPVHHIFGQQFDFNLQPDDVLIRLTCPLELALHVGDQWQFMVKLRRIHGTQNPGTFDFEAYALQKKLRAAGRIVASKNNKRLQHEKFQYPLQRLRQYLRDKITQAIPDAPTLPWIKALTLGERSDATAHDWEVLRQTGTNHLMAVGGLHIGLLAGFIHSLMFYIWRRIPKSCLILPAQQASACFAFLAALWYGVMTNFLLPGQRACLMLSVLLANLLCKRQINSWHSWSLALLLVLLLNPLTILSESFWLSFVTIALIIYGMSNRLAVKGMWWKWGRLQCLLSIGLIPLGALFFHECSLVSFVANTIAIPWLGFLVLPFCFTGSLFALVSQTTGHIFLNLADKSLSALWKYLNWLTLFDWSNTTLFIPAFFSFFLMVSGILLLLLPAGMPGRWFGLIWIASIFAFKPATPSPKHLWFTLLDVGQGLSAVIQTQHHVLVYDTGAKFPHGFDMGERVVLPFLRKVGIQKIDMLVISHGDNDHAGGATYLWHSLPISQIKTSETTLLPTYAASLCKAGKTWQWDGVNFSFLSPAANLYEKNIKHKRNNLSCVLLIDNGKHKILLPGDIEKETENILVQGNGKQIKSDIIIAPHHGSKTSGLNAFIAAVKPNFVLYATGYRNHYHFPHPSVLKKYAAQNCSGYDSASSGAIQFKLDDKNQLTLPQQYRLQHARYWYDG